MTDRFITVPDSLELPAAVKVGVDRLHDSTVAGRALLTGADAAAQRSSLGLGTAATASVGDFATAEQGAKADASDVATITVTGSLALAVPEGHPAGQVYRVTLTQDSTGGHTVTYDDVPLTIDTTAGATTLVEVWPGGKVAYPGATGSGSLDTEAVQDVVGAMVTAAGGSYNDAMGTITLPAGGGGTTGPLAMFSALPASPVQWQPYEYRYTEETVWPATIVWPSGQPATVGWGVATLVWDGIRWCGEWTTMFGTNTAGTGNSYAPTVTLQEVAKTMLAVSQPFTTYDPDGHPVTVTADWGDDTTPSTVTSPATHTYELNGTYTAAFTPNDGGQNGAPALATYKVTAADVTVPVAGTLAASAPTTSGLTLTVSGASDSGVGLHSKPYRFSTNDGGVWTDWQASATYAATGLLSGTPYTCKHQTRDAVGNAATGASIIASTTGAAATFQDAVLGHGAAGYWKLTETTGTTITDYSGNGRHGTLTGIAGTDYNLASVDGALQTLTGSGGVTIPDADPFTITAAGLTVVGFYKIVAEKSGRLIGKNSTNQGEWTANAAGQTLEAGGLSPNLQWINYARTTGPVFPFPAVWKMFVVRFPGIPTPGVYPTLSINDEVAEAVTTAGSASTYANGTSPVQIAGSNVQGGLRHFVVFPSALTDAQVLQLRDLAVAEGFIA